MSFWSRLEAELRAKVAEKEAVLAPLHLQGAAAAGEQAATAPAPPVRRNRLDGFPSAPETWPSMVGLPGLPNM